MEHNNLFVICSILDIGEGLHGQKVEYVVYGWPSIVRAIAIDTVYEGRFGNVVSCLQSIFVIYKLCDIYFTKLLKLLILSQSCLRKLGSGDI